MIRALVISWLSGVMLLQAAPDLLRFANGDQLHGTFRGIKEGPEAMWQRDDVEHPFNFKTGQLRHIVLRGGRPAKSLESLSHVALVNGDRVPGKITAMDGGSITLETSFAGPLKIPRDQVTMLAPSPLGGRIRYHGPFIEDEWKMAHALFPEGMPPAPAVDESGGDAGKKQEKDTTGQPGRWLFSGASWYWTGKQFGTALYRENAMPDRAILKFDMAWKNRLSLAVAFHADLMRPRQDGAEDGNGEQAVKKQRGIVPGDSTILPSLFGNSYVLHLFSTHMMLFRTAVNEQGEAAVPERVPINGNGIRLGEAGKATVEIRSSRTTGEISLFVNDEFVVQWSEGGTDPKAGASYAGKGNGFGFVVQGEDTAVRLSDIMVAEWNGMPDSARSLQVNDQDIVLLANGTDRFSGKILSLADDKVNFEGKYGRFQFQLGDVAEIRFARNGLARASEVSAGDMILRMSPLGRVSGRPVSGTGDSLRIASPIYGNLDFNLDPVVMVDFQGGGNFIDDWEVEF